MKKYIKILTLMLSLVWVISLSFVSKADAAIDSENCLVEDNGHMFTGDWASGSEYMEICEMAQKIADDYNINLAIVTTNTLDGKSAMEFADDTYNQKFGINTDGLLLLIEYDGEYERYYWISTSGSCIKTFDDERIDSLGDEFTSHFSSDKAYYMTNGSYYIATKEFLDNITFCLENPRNIAISQEESDDNTFKFLGVAFIASIVITTFVMVALKSQLKTVHFASGAKNYERPGSMEVTHKSDIFLYKNVSRSARVKSSSGSSTHTSSSGGHHGGGGGAF